MTKTTKIILISLGVIGCGVGVWFLFFRDKKGNQFPEVEEESNEEKKKWNQQNQNNYTSEGDPLKILSQGENVKCLQSVLNVKGCKDKNGSGLAVDGYFGPLTESALEGCGKGKSITLSELRTMMQEQLNAGLSVDCSSSSCCANVSAVISSPTTGCDNDWDCDGIPDLIDKDVNPNMADALYNPTEQIDYTDPSSPYYNPPAVVDSTYVHIPEYHNIYYNQAGKTWFDKQNNEY